MTTQWLHWVKQLHAIGKIGLEYSDNEYDRERYEQILAIASEITENHTDHTQETIIDVFNHESGYITPKVDVRGIIFKGNQVLLVKEREDGKWTVPGGWADVGLTPSENVVKEIEEESGYQAKVLRLLAVYDRDKQGHKPPLAFHVYKLFFLCEITGGHAQDSHETSDVRFFSLDNLPELSVGRVMAHQLHHFYSIQDTSVTEID